MRNKLFAQFRTYFHRVDVVVGPGKKRGFGAETGWGVPWSLRRDCKGALKGQATRVGWGLRLVCGWNNFLPVVKLSWNGYPTRNGILRFKFWTYYTLLPLLLEVKFRLVCAIANSCLNIYFIEMASKLDIKKNYGVVYFMMLYGTFFVY